MHDHASWKQQLFQATKILLVLNVTEASCVTADSHIVARAQSYTNAYLGSENPAPLSGSDLYLSFCVNPIRFAVDISWNAAANRATI